MTASRSAVRPTTVEGSTQRSWIAVCEAPFVPATDGGRREHLGMIRALAARDGLAAVVVCAPLADRVDPRDYVDVAGGVPVVVVPRRTSPLAHARPLVPFVWASRRASRGHGTLDLERLGRRVDADAVLACSFKSAELADSLARRLGLPLVVRQHNVESDYHRDVGRAHGGARRAYYALEAWRIARAERRLARSPRLCGYAEISAVDRDRRRARAARAVLVPPLAIDFARARPADPAGTDRSGVVFLGALDVATNQAGLRWFLDDVWPRVREAHPAAEMVVAGRTPDAAFDADLRGRPGVRTRYDVGDPEALVRGAVVAVNPTVSGSGVNIKLLEYAAAGTAVVTTTRAAAGLPPLPPGVLPAADAAPAFADLVGGLLAEPSAARALGLRLRAALREAVDADVAVRALSDLAHPAVTLTEES